ncbi:hypothetical protein [Bacteroides fluxus]|uniref:hypothetical protein n=1 Tax=Bacteroides fluxus TaxID=626930 RepID=UPI002A833276|nr:hypothetical protein [Bacteroides fluxus]MDY3789365.1 hypothetical protein [Bacteroides fluxus]
MAEQDIRENAMGGGTPARLRGIAVNGDSISPTLEEVVSKMPVATESSKGLMSVDDRLNLRLINIMNSTDKKINLGRVYGLFRFVLWSSTNSPSLYLIDAIGGNITYIAGYDIAAINYSLAVDSNGNLTLSYNGTSYRTTHIRGVAEAFR